MSPPDIWTLWFTFFFAILALPMLIEWWLDKLFDDSRLGYRLLSLGIHYYQGAWVFPQNETRMNTSFQYGAAPYKEFRIGPFGWRRYL